MRSHYFCTSPHLVAGPRPRPAADGLFHAKTMGTQLTACGLNASSWPKLWDVPFRSGAASSCRDCGRVVQEVPRHQAWSPSGTGSL